MSNKQREALDAAKTELVFLTAYFTNISKLEGINRTIRVIDDALAEREAVIEANSASALADLKPAEKAEILDSFDAWELYRADIKPKFYSGEQVSALIQRNAELNSTIHNLRNGIMFDRIDWEDYPEISRDAFKDLMEMKATS